MSVATLFSDSEGELDLVQLFSSIALVYLGVKLGSKHFVMVDWTSNTPQEWRQSPL